MSSGKEVKEIRIAPPNLSTAPPELVALGRYLRNNRIEKQRTALLNGSRVDMFKGKRFIRALLSEDYKKAQQKNPILPKVETNEQACAVLARFPLEQFAFNVEKLDTNDAIFRGLKPLNGIPVVLISPQQKIDDDQYFVWFYNYTPITAYLKSVGVVLGVVCIALFQLWPIWARKLAYYASLGTLVLLGVLLGLAVVRTILFMVTYVIMPKALWIFPNLFADVGILQSFRPLYSFGNDPTLPPPERRKKRVSKPLSYYQEKAQKAKETEAAKTSGPGGPGGPGGPINPNGPNGPNGGPPQQVTLKQVQFPFTPDMMVPGPQKNTVMLHPKIAQHATECMKKADNILRETLNKGPVSIDQIQELRQSLAMKEWDAAAAERANILKSIHTK